MAIRVFIYDDHHDRRESLKALIGLQEEFYFAGDAENCKDAVEDMNTYYPDVVLMDINMPEVDGLAGLREIKINHPEIKVLMQTVLDDSETIFKAIKNGASGYILKSDKPQRILQAIQEVYDGGAVMHPFIAQKVLDYFKPNEHKSPLSPKEKDVLAIVAQGNSYKMTADILSLSYSTVNTHIKRIYEKLHINSLGEAIAYYYRNLNR